MALQFPTTPTLNQTYQSGSSGTYKWNGSYWEVTAPNQTKLTIITASYSERVAWIQADAPPTSTGSMWYDIDTGNTYIKYDSAWVPVQSNTVNATSASFTTMNEWIAAGTCSISATTTNPTKGTIVQDNVRYRKVNATTWEVEYKYAQSTAGNAGSGTYVFALPSALAFGASVIQSTSATVSVLQNSAIPATATQAWGGPSIRPLMVVPRTSNNFQLITLNGTFNSAIVSSANTDWTAGTTFMIRFYVDTN